MAGSMSGWCAWKWKPPANYRKASSMSNNRIFRSKMHIVSIVVALILISISISEFYFERTSYLKATRKWHEDLIEIGENEYRGYKTIWSELSQNQKQRHYLDIERLENRINHHLYLIVLHAYNLTLNIILFIGLLHLKRWVKGFLIYWILSDFIVIPIYFYIVGYDPLLKEHFAALSNEMKLFAILLIIVIYSCFFIIGRSTFKLIDSENI